MGKGEDRGKEAHLARLLLPRLHHLRQQQLLLSLPSDKHTRSCISAIAYMLPLDGTYMVAAVAACLA